LASENKINRLEILIILFLIITCFYAVEGIFILGQAEYESQDMTGLVQENPEIIDPENFTYTEGQELGFDPLSIVIGFIGFLSFAPLGLPIWASVSLSIFMSIVGIIIVYLIYTFIRDWIPFVG